MSKSNPAPVPLKNVRINDPFWSRYDGLIREAVIPYQWDALNDNIPGAAPSHAVHNFKIAAGLEQGEFEGLVFQDSDLAKWIEAVGYSLITHPDPDLEQTADGLIDIIEKAQRPDGYLNTYFILKEPSKRWTNLAECHELYCAGHMIEAAVAYYQAAGKRKLLDVTCRFADHIDSVFGPEEDKLKGYPGHQEIELALVKLYKTTGNEKYLKLAKYFIDERGRQPNYFDVELEKRGRAQHWDAFRDFGRSYNQAHVPVREQTEAVGHSVRAAYMYSGMADIAAETGDETLKAACKRLWDNIADKRMYITGGIGSTEHGEAFTFDYDLPNGTVYAETCASIGLIFFARRMLALEADAKYADVMERALYNTAISGISLDGRRFFYVNPLETLPEASEKDPGKRHVKVTRQKWFACACCPPNVARLLASLGEYIYTADDDTVFVNLYIGGEARIDLGAGSVSLVQETGYPWDETVIIKIIADKPLEFTLAMRAPGWCDRMDVSVNGEPAGAVTLNGYARVGRTWSGGDCVEIKLDMPARRVRANPAVREDIGKVALQRGPIVYCLEEADNGKNLHEIVLPIEVELTVGPDDRIPGGAPVIKADALRVDSAAWGGGLYRADAALPLVPLKALFIPYFAWANREPGEMTVWIREV